MEIEVSNRIRNCILSKDIYSTRGKLLLSQGHILDTNDINLLQGLKITKVFIEKDLEQIEQIFTSLYSNGLSKVKNLFYQAANDEKIELDVAIKIINDIREYISTHKELLFGFVAKAKIDDYTIQHSLNVGILSSIMAELYGLSTEEITRISHAGLLHDIGKALIPKEILLKPCELSNEEFETMKDHAIYGCEILKRNNITDEYILSAASMHHERFNGVGYPYGLHGDDIPLVAQIVAIADVFDAITSRRVYKDPQSIIKAYQELKDCAFNNELNASIVLKFLERLSYMFVGKRVLLSNNMIGKVIKPNLFDYERPFVEVEGQIMDLNQYQDIKMVSFIE